jgi:hypothetical protein
MSEETQEISVELPLPPLKSAEKAELIKIITENFQTHAKTVNLKDSYYVEKRSAETLDIFALVFQIVIPTVAFTNAILSITNFVLGLNRQNIINVTKKNGKKVRIFDGMTEEEIKKLLEE